ncbi:hypothetical protein [Primorskyibacter sp. S187A]|uniref:hypothetical protein n=1 Tax=Primorskyibacter sp. S187A TaxID=3415130 RepID=UPI003C7A6168
MPRPAGRLIRGIALLWFVILLCLAAALALLWITQLPNLRWIMAAHLIVAGLTLPVELYGQNVLDAAGCTGNALKGLSCPEWSWLIRVAVFQQFASLLVFAYFTAVFPLVWAVCAVIECVARVWRRRAS